MEDLNNYITGDTLTSAKFVQPMSELQNVIEGTGQALASGDLNQLGKGISDYVANGTFSTDSGAADAYVLTTIGSKQSPTAYTDGMVIDFVAGNNNTGASTVNAYGLGVKNIKIAGGSDPAAGDIAGRVKAIYDLANGWFELVSPTFNGGISTNNLLHIQHRVASGVGGGASAVGFQTRPINTVVTNNITGASLATNIITLPAGTYYCDALSGLSDVNLHQCGLYNSSDAAYLLNGSSENSNSGVDSIFTKSSVCGVFTINASKSVILRHWGGVIGSFGIASTTGQVEIYADVKIWRVA